MADYWGVGERQALGDLLRKQLSVDNSGASGLDRSQRIVLQLLGEPSCSGGPPERSGVLFLSPPPSPSKVGCLSVKVL